MIGYPYYPPYYPGYGPQPQMKPPEQYQAELLAQIKPQMDQYAKIYGEAKTASRGGQYFVVGSYEEAKAVQAPADGKPVMIFDENAGRLYQKHMENGQAYIRGFSLSPLEESGSQKKEQPEENMLLQKLNEIERRLERLEDKGYGKPAGVDASFQPKEEEPSAL